MYNHEPKGYVCPLCPIVKGEETQFVKRDDIIFDNGKVLAYVSPKWWPNNPGNVIVIPHKHIENIYDIPNDLFTEINLVGKKIATVMKREYGCDGVSFRQHNEPAGGQDVWHFHLHVLPRWKGDDLYLRHKESRFVTSEEMKLYADKLREKII